MTQVIGNILTGFSIVALAVLVALVVVISIVVD